MSHKLADTIAQLQRQADHCAWLFATNRLQIEYRIAYATGVAHPWRLIETHRKQGGPILRRMHCFTTLDSLRKYIEELSSWKRQDRALAASELPGSGMILSQATEPQSEEDGTSIELIPLEERRRALREKLCVTKADRVVNLSIVPRFSTTKAPQAPAHA